MTKPEKMKAFFKTHINGYDEHMRMNVNDYEQIYSAIAEPFDKSKETVRLLDLGCGTGLELEAVFKKLPNAFITAIDLSEEMLSQLQKKFSIRKAQLSLIVGSYMEVEFPDNTYDYALSVMTMHHLNKTEKEKVYQKLYHTLKKNAHYIEADYVVSPQEEARMLEDYKALKEKYHINDMYNYHVDIPFSKQTQVKLFKQAGFECIETLYEFENACIFNCKKERMRSGG